MPRKIENVIGRFESKYIPVTESGCWLWTGAVAKCRNGDYGLLTWFGGKMRLAHRVSYELFKGPINDLCVLHKCDTPLCVNPDHMFLGTRKDNIDDMLRKGRRTYKSGADARTAKLTESQVREIRSLKDQFSTRQLAKMFGIGSSAMHKITSGRSWKKLL